MHKNLILLGIFLLLIGCETTSPTTKIIPEPSEKVIYQPDEDTTNEIEENLNSEKNIVIEVQDFTGIEKIGRAHVRTPVTSQSRMPSSA